MAKPVIIIDGLEELQRKLIKNATLNDVKKAVKQNGSELSAKMVRNASFSQGYQTGQTKRTIRLNLKDGGLTAEVGPETSYSPYVEYGTRFMEAQPFVKPAFEAQKVKFKRDMDKLVR